VRALFRLVVRWFELHEERVDLRADREKLRGDGVPVHT